MRTVPLSISGYLFRLCFSHAARSTLDTVTVPNGVYQYPTEPTTKKTDVKKPRDSLSGLALAARRLVFEALEKDTSLVAAHLMRLAVLSRASNNLPMSPEHQYIKFY